MKERNNHVIYAMGGHLIQLWLIWSGHARTAHNNASILTSSKYSGHSFLLSSRSLPFCFLDSRRRFIAGVAIEASPELELASDRPVFRRLWPEVDVLAAEAPWVLSNFLGAMIP